MTVLARLAPTSILLALMFPLDVQAQGSAGPPDGENAEVPTPLDVSQLRSAETRVSPDSPPEGGVIEQIETSAIISLGSVHGIEDGDSIELFERRRVKLAGGRVLEQTQTLAVGRVVDVSEDVSRVELGVNERVPRGALARPTNDLPSASPVAPPRNGDIWELHLGVRPLLAIGNVGGGAITTTQAVFRFEGPFALHLNSLPNALAGGRQGLATSLNSDLTLAYDQRIFSIGLGAGVAAVDDFDLDDDGVDGRATLMLSQFARLGARDGFHVAVNNAFYLGANAYRLLGITAAVQIPLNTLVDDSWFVFETSARGSGHFFADAGLRMLLRGNGGRGSLFATFTAGGGSVLQEVSAPCTDDGAHCEDTTSYRGPLVGAHLEWRL